jgi:predicted O-methyltransferase YrrM
LRVLAAQVREGVVGEMGTGCGVGAAWLASALAPGVSLVTIELDAARAAAAGEVFAGVPNVRVLHGDWRELLPHGPFALLFADGGKAKQHEPAALVAALRPGGLLVLDDLTPEDRWPAEWRGKPDPVREFWLNDPRLAATELLVSPNMAVIVAARLR